MKSRILLLCMLAIAFTIFGCAAGGKGYKRVTLSDETKYFNFGQNSISSINADVRLQSKYTSVDFVSLLSDLTKKRLAARSLPVDGTYTHNESKATSRQKKLDYLKLSGRSLVLIVESHLEENQQNNASFRSIGALTDFQKYKSLMESCFKKVPNYPAQPMHLPDDNGNPEEMYSSLQNYMTPFVDVALDIYLNQYVVGCGIAP